MAESNNELEIVIRAKTDIQQAFDKASGHLRLFEHATKESMRNTSAEMEKFNYSHYTALNAVSRREAELLGLQTSAVARRRQLMAMDTNSLEQLYQKHAQFSQQAGTTQANWAQAWTAISTSVTAGLAVWDHVTAVLGTFKNFLGDVLGLAGRLKDAFLGAMEATAKWGAHAEELHQALGLSTESASQLMFVSQSLTGNTTELDEVIQGLIRSLDMTRFMQEKAAAAADQHTKSGKATASALQAVVNLDNPMRAALSKWKIQIDDLGTSQEDAITLLDRIITKGYEYRGTLNVASMATDIFKHNSALMIELMARGPDEFEKMMAAAGKYGQVIGGQDARASQDFIIAQNQMGLALEGLRNNFMKPLIPVFTQIIDKVKEWVNTNQDGFKRAGEAIADFWNSHAAVVFKWFEEKGPGVLKAISDGLFAIVKRLTGSEAKSWEAFFASFKDLKSADIETFFNKVGLMVEKLAGSLKKVADLIGFVQDPGGTISQRAYDRYSERLAREHPDQWYIDPQNGLMHRATGGFASGRTLVGERGPEMVSLPPGSYVHTADETKQMSGGQTFHNTFNIRNESDPLAIARFLSFQLSHAGRF